MLLYGKEGIDISNQAIDIQNVKKEINHKTILKPISHQVAKGKILALCGGNGAGKSTLIRMIAGLIKPSEGSITINGIQKKENKNSYLEQIGYMPDDFQFQHAIRARESLEFYAKLKGVSKDRTSEILKQVGLLESQHKKMGAFSKGMRQRMLLAQALLSNPPILLLDEPTNGLDPYWVQSFMKMMIDFKNRGQTIVLSTHDLNVAEEIADEVIFLYDGQVLSKGPSHEYRPQGLYHTFQELIFQRKKTS